MHVYIQDVHQEAGGRARRVPKSPWARYPGFCCSRARQIVPQRRWKPTNGTQSVTLYLHRYCGTHKKKIYIRRENLISIVCQCFKKHTKWQVTKTEFSWAYNILIFENHSERDFNSYLKPYSVKYTIKCVHRLVYVRKSFLAIYLRENKYLEDIKNSWI